MEIEITIKGRNGASVVTSTSERNVPYIEELERKDSELLFAN